MSEDEEDIYSDIYSALRHPIRRRILYMLSEMPRTFTEMLNVIGIESSHLTYHLESLRELIFKAEDGSYELSTFGEAAVYMLGKVMHARGGKGSEKITKYWLPFERAPTLDSIAVDKDDVWFCLSWPPLRGVGQIKLKDSKAEFNNYILIDRRMESVISVEKGMYQLQERWGGVGQGIAAHDGYVWYGEQEGIFRRKQTGPSSWTGIPTPKKQALCKMHTKTHRVTRYLFPPDEVYLNQLAYRLSLDSSGCRVWGATYGNKAFVLDTADKKLKVFTIGKTVERIGKTVERRVEEDALRVAGYTLRDVVVEPNGKHGWFISFMDALYLFNSKDESLLKYPLKGFYLKMVDLAPDGKIWCTSATHATVPMRNLHPHIELGYILSLDPKTNELTAYLVPTGLLHPNGILITDKGEVWLGFNGCISKINPEKAEGSTTVMSPEELEEWRLMEYDVTEVEGEEIHPNTFELYPDQLIRYEKSESDLKYLGVKGFLIYPLEYITPATGRDFVQDSQGRIWFTTWRGGYIGVLTP